MLQSFVAGPERLWASIKAMKLKSKQSADLSSWLQSSHERILACESDEEEPEGTSAETDSGGQEDKDVTEALQPQPSTLVSFEYLELFQELQTLFKAPKCLLIRSSYKTLHETLMSQATAEGARGEIARL